MSKSPTAVLDDLDRELVDILSRDARISNRKIGLDLGVTEGTVRGRIKRLQQEGLIAFTAITNIGLVDSSKLAFIGVQADISRSREIAEQIADMPQVNAVMTTMGRFSITAFCLFSELDRLHHVASVEILGLEGVHHVEISIAVHTVKNNLRIARILVADRQNCVTA